MTIDKQKTLDAYQSHMAKNLLYTDSERERYYSYAVQDIAFVPSEFVVYVTCECATKNCSEHKGTICQNLDVQAYTIKNDETGVERSINLCGDCVYDLANNL